MDTEGYWGILDEFLSSGWNEAVLNRYFRATRPLYATQIYVPEIKADAAPRAFGVGDIVSPSLWLIHYKGQVSPPRNGTFRFVGYCDDIMSVAVNSKVVLTSGWPNMNRINQVLRKTAWDSTGRQGRRFFSGHLQNGDWFTLKAGEIIDLDLIIGERPGGAFSAVLFIEEQGKSYEKVEGHPLLPLFQLAPAPMPKSKRDGNPLFSDTPDLWQGIQ
ncbi:MAG: hypothetical protein HC888_01130 [Candidatus Competibacteraceae bacterium]|nr:hypothetical protein [Candidatus Competibacteraceae bacterium]